MWAKVAKRQSEDHKAKFMNLEPVYIMYLTKFIRGRPQSTSRLKGGGGPSRCDSLWQGGGGQEHVTSCLYILLSYILNMKFKVMFNFLL